MLRLDHPGDHDSSCQSNKQETRIQILRRRVKQQTDVTMYKIRRHLCKFFCSPLDLVKGKYIISLTFLTRRAMSSMWY